MVTLVVYVFGETEQGHGHDHWIPVIMLGAIGYGLPPVSMLQGILTSVGVELTLKAVDDCRHEDPSVQVPPESAIRSACAITVKVIWLPAGPASATEASLPMSP